MTEGSGKKNKTIVVKPPNPLKQKVGSGGIDKKAIEKAQTALEENDIDFKPFALKLIGDLNKAMADIKSGEIVEDVLALEALSFPVMQLKAQGAMFKYPLITDLSFILIEFLEALVTVDKSVLDVVDLHQATVQVVLFKEMKGDHKNIAKELCDKLINACDCYNRAKEFEVL